MSESVNGISPAGRTKITLGDIARNISENEYNPKEKGLDRCVGLEHLDPGSLKISRWSPITPEMSFTRRFRKGQILFGKRRAYQKKVALADFDGICSSDILVIEAKRKILLPDLLPHILQDDRFFEYAVGTSSGSLSPRTKWKFLAEYEIWLPSLDEQHRIATTLWSAEDCIVKGERFVAAAGRVKQVLMEELFSKGIGHVEFKNTPFGSIPATWESCKLSEIIDLNYGSGLGASVRVKGNVPVFGSSGIIGNHNRAIVKGPGIIIGRKGSIGQINWCDIDFWPIDTTYYLINKNNNDLKWLFYKLVFLNLKTLNSATAVPGLNRNDILSQSISLPPLSEQRLIASILTRCDETIAVARANVLATRTLKMKVINELLNPDMIE